MKLPSKTPLLLSLAMLPLGLSSAIAHDEPAGASQAQNSSWKTSSPLVSKVRRATARYRDINVAIGEEWVPATPCVSGPNAGAMGVHFVFGPRVRDGSVDADEPEALIYEPLPNGAMRLVGVEFIVVAEDWEAKHPMGPTPSIDGHLMHYIGAPNRYGLPAFYELHVWAWEHNPDGHFADWNRQVSCNRQPA